MVNWVLISSILKKFGIFLKGAFLVVSSRIVSVASFIMDYVKKIGISTIMAYIFILGFMFKALVQFSQDLNFGLLIFSVSSVFVASEVEILNNINILKEGLPLSFFGHIMVYVNIIGALIIFVYIIKLLNKIQSVISSNASYVGLGPTMNSLLILGLLEFSVLAIYLVASSGGNILSVFTVEVIPFRGLMALIFNIPLLLEPLSSYFGSSATNEITINNSELINKSIEELTNSSTQKSVLSKILCGLSPRC